MAPDLVEPEVMNVEYEGAGTETDSYLVKWILHDPRNPMLFSPLSKWSITMLKAFATLAVALASSAYSGGATEIMAEFKVSQELAIKSISPFVSGSAIGSLFWRPPSELFGRHLTFFVSYAALTMFNAGCAGAQNPETLIILRLFARAFGSSLLNNSGGVIADMFLAANRGQELVIFAAAPFLGLVLGPATGGFIGVNAGWRWTVGFLAILANSLWAFGSFSYP